MKIPYFLMKNPFNSPGQSRYVAKVKKPGILYQEDLIDAMLYKNTTLTRQDILGVLDLMRETVREKTMSGYSVHTDLFRAGVSIKGDFTSFVDRFDKKRHRVCVNMKAALDFQKDIAKEASAERVSQRSYRPTILDVQRLTQNSEGDFYTPGDLVEARGYALKREDGKSPAYLFTEEEGADWKKDRIPLRVHRVFDRAVLCTLPDDLLPGSYRLYVDSSIDRSLPYAESPILNVVDCAACTQTE
jgi:hypothetical protein